MKARILAENTVCTWCGEPITKGSPAVLHNKGVFCSSACALESAQAANDEVANTRKRLARYANDNCPETHGEAWLDGFWAAVEELLPKEVK